MWVIDAGSRIALSAQIAYRDIRDTPMTTDRRKQLVDSYDSVLRANKSVCHHSATLNKPLSRNR